MNNKDNNLLLKNPSRNFSYTTNQIKRQKSTILQRNQSGKDKDLD